MSSLISFFKNRERKKFTSLLFKLPLAFVAFTTFSLSAEATPQTNTTECDNGLSPALGYNAFIQYRVTVGGGDTEGPIAMGDDLTLNGTFTVAAHTGGTYFYNGESQAASLVVNGKIIYKSNQGINLTGNELNNLTNFTFNNKPSANSPFIINVNYAGDFVWNVQNQAGIGDQEGVFIIYNFYNTSKVTINGGGTIMGTLLAPYSHVEKKTSGNINGQVIAKSYNHLSGELHQNTYNHCEAKICAPAVDAGKNQTICSGEVTTLTA